MTTIREFFPQIRALFSNFWKRTGETSPLPPLVTRLNILKIHSSKTFEINFSNKNTHHETRCYKQDTSSSSYTFFTTHNNFLQLEIHYVHNWTHLMPLVSFDTPWKHQKTIGFLMFSWVIKRDQWHKID